MRVTFLESSFNIKLAKTITATETKAYPDVKTVTSIEKDINPNKWAPELANLLLFHGGKGHCMLKGPLKRPLVSESRAMAGDKLAMTDMLVIDVDNLKVPKEVLGPTPLYKKDVQRIAEYVLEHLGPEFETTSYVAQASASLGTKPGRVSLHIFMKLSVPLPPKSLKLWLKHANLNSQVFRDQVGLSSTGQSLKYPLDPSVADNTKIIFIAPPGFAPKTLDPFADDPTQRIISIVRDNDAIDIAAKLMNVNPEKVFSDTNTLRNELRDKHGLRRKNAHIETVNLNGENLEVVTNPDKMSISIVSDQNAPFIRCNINNGDSGAYYFNVDDPTYMYNFKEEPIFKIEDADKDFYELIFEKYKNVSTVPGATLPLRAMVMRDFKSDTIYNGVYDPNSDTFVQDYPLTPCSAASVEGFMRSHGLSAPDYIPEARLVFDPPRLDIKKQNLTTIPYHVNLYQESEVMLKAIPPTDPISYDNMKSVYSTCPNIMKLITHICGDGRTEVAHFVNWLAYIYQKKQKTMTAWVLGGVPGTGKGVFVNKVLRPLFGPPYVTMKSLENIEEQFNSFMHTSIFLVVDEFHMGAAKGGRNGSDRIQDKLKNQITEPTVTLRAMRSNQVEVKSFTNFIFLTNRADAVRIEKGDRRYNVAPRQEVKLLDKFPTFKIDALGRELLDFAGALQTAVVDEHRAQTCLENAAKEYMQSMSASVFEDFCRKLAQGQIEDFLEVLAIELTDTFNANRILAAQRLIKSWLADIVHKRYTLVGAESLRNLYHVMNENGRPMSLREFSKYLARNGLTPGVHRISGANKSVRGVKIIWEANVRKAKDLIEELFKDEDKALLQV